MTNPLQVSTTGKEIVIAAEFLWSKRFPQADFRASGLKRLNEIATVFTYGRAGTIFSRTAEPTPSNVELQEVVRMWVEDF